MAIGHLSEHADAQETRRLVVGERVEYLVIRTDLSSAANCHKAVERVVAKWEHFEVLVKASSPSSSLT